MPAAKQVGATWDEEQWDAGSPSTVVARKPTIMRMLILWAVIFGSVVCGGATGVCGDAELLPERPEGRSRAMPTSGFVRGLTLVIIAACLGRAPATPLYCFSADSA